MDICVATVAHKALDHRVFHKEAKSAAAAGYRVTVVAPADGETVRDGVRIEPVRPWSGPLGRIRAAFQVSWRALRTKADIYHFHDPELMPFFWIVRLLTRKPVIADIHEYFPQVIQARGWVPQIFRGAAEMLFKGLEAVNARIVDAVVVVTASMAPLFPGAKRCVVVRNMASADFGTAGSQLTVDRKYDVVHLGSLTASRARMIAAVAEDLENRGKACEWLLLGISEEASEWLRQNTSEAVFARLHGLPYVAHDEVPAYLRACRVGFNYHPYEPRFMVAIPLKIFEYLCCGVPIVCTALPHVAEFMEQVDCGELITDNEPSTFAEAILRLLDDPALAAEKARRGRDAVVREHCWEREAEKLLRLYEELAGPAGQTGRKL